jgi:hypothetical protein
MPGEIPTFGPTPAAPTPWSTFCKKKKPPDLVSQIRVKPANDEAEIQKKYPKDARGTIFL